MEDLETNDSRNN